MTLDSIFEKIKEAEKIVILTHENPDGDAIGSSTAMSLALKKLGKVVKLNSIKHKFLFLNAKLIMSSHMHFPFYSAFKNNEIKQEI